MAYRILAIAGYCTLAGLVALAIAGSRYGAEVFISWMGIVFLAGVVNVISGFRHKVVFMLSRDVSKEDEPATYGFLLGVSTLMVVGVTIAIVLIAMTKA